MDRLEDGGFDKYEAYLDSAALNLEVSSTLPLRRNCDFDTSTIMPFRTEELTDCCISSSSDQGIESELHNVRKILGPCSGAPSPLHADRFASSKVGLPNFIEEKFTPQRLPEFALNALSNSPLENHHKQLCRRFQNPKMRALLSFQDLYVGEALRYISKADSPLILMLLSNISILSL